MKEEDEVSSLADERVSLLLKLGTCKDEVSPIRAEALKEKKTLEEAYEEGFNVIFNYGYGCYAYVHNIYRSQPEVLDGMSDTSKSLSLEFFINPRCPLGVVPAETISTDVRPGKVTNAPKRRLPLQFLRQMIARQASISLPPRLGRVKSLLTPLRVTRESEEHGVSGLYFVVTH